MNNKIKFQSLSSGSSGNCYYLGIGEKGVLIDAGIGGRRLKQFLEEINVSMEQIMGVVITHNHSDHTKGLLTLTKRCHIPVYTTEIVWKNILKSTTLKNIPVDCIRKIIPGQPFQIFDFNFTAFNVSHDTPETLGYHIEILDRKITVVTDLGHICENAARYISAANFLVIESNYDLDMLKNGRYPEYLKQRIRGNSGHLDNLVTSEFIAKNMHSELTHVCLAHLSKDNNKSELALAAIKKAFNNQGLFLKANPEVMVLKRDLPSELIHL